MSFKWSKVSDHYLDISNMNILLDRYVFYINNKVKQTRSGKNVQLLELIAYPAEEKLCIVKYLNEYVSRTSTLRREGMKQLLVGFIKLHSSVSTGTISR